MSCKVLHWKDEVGMDDDCLDLTGRGSRDGFKAVSRKASSSGDVLALPFPARS